jgi:hypothetical protein
MLQFYSIYKLLGIVLPRFMHRYLYSFLFFLYSVNGTSHVGVLLNLHTVCNPTVFICWQMWWTVPPSSNVRQIYRDGNCNKVCVYIYVTLLLAVLAYNGIGYTSQPKFLIKFPITRLIHKPGSFFYTALRKTDKKFNFSPSIDCWCAPARCPNVAEWLFWSCTPPSEYRNMDFPYFPLRA